MPRIGDDLRLRLVSIEAVAGRVLEHTILLTKFQSLIQADAIVVQMEVERECVSPTRTSS